MSKQAGQWLDLNYPPFLNTSDNNLLPAQDPTPLRRAMASSKQPQESQDLYLRRLLDPSDPDWRNWADGLPLELRELIAERLLDDDEKDLVHFRAVCGAWRKSIGNENGFNRRVHPRRWILLPEHSSDTVCKFVNIATGQRIQLQDLHQLIGHSVAEGPDANPEGVLVLRDDSTLVIRLFNPLTRQLVDLPSLKTLMVEGDSRLSEKQFKERHEVTAAGFVGSSSVVLYFDAISMIVVAKPGDERWVVVTRNQSLVSVVTMGDHFYCLSTESLFELSATTNPPQLVVVSQIVHSGNIILNTLRVVDNGGELLILWYELHLDSHGFWYIWCAARQIDFDEGVMVPNYYFNDRAVFVGSRGAVSVSTKNFPGLDANTIYFRYCCNNAFTKQCLLRNIYVCYQPPADSFAKCLSTYVNNFSNVNCHSNFSEMIAETELKLGL